MRLLFISFFISTICFAQNQNPKINYSYFNQLAPGNSPVLFAPDIVSDEFGNRDMAISPSGNDLFYTLQYRSGFVFSTIMHSKKINGKWSNPEVASFSGQYDDEEPTFSPDGNRLYFSSARPISGTEKKITIYGM